MMKVIKNENVLYGRKYCTVDEFYYINEDERTIVCILKPSAFWEGDYFEKYVGWERGVRVNLDYHLAKEYRGIAKCSLEDTWDETVGMKLARYRARRKIDGEINADVKEIVKTLREKADNIESNCMRFK